MQIEGAIKKRGGSGAAAAAAGKSLPTAPPVNERGCSMCWQQTEDRQDTGITKYWDYDYRTKKEGANILRTQFRKREITCYANGYFGGFAGPWTQWRNISAKTYVEGLGNRRNEGLQDLH
jgi:hypothetical protein